MLALSSSHPVGRTPHLAATTRAPFRRRRQEIALYAVASLLFVASTALTVAWSASMPAGDGMPMPGGWTMSMAWMRMPGRTWASAAASFLGMWTVMMVAMMLPSLVPVLRANVDRGPWRVAASYFGAWSLCGVAVYAIGVGIAALTMAVPMLSRLVPAATATVVGLAGVVQFTPWKARRLACWGQVAGDGPWRRGMRLARQCGLSCGNLMAVLLVLGVMDLRVMAIVAVAITAERLRR